MSQPMQFTPNVIGKALYDFTAVVLNSKGRIMGTCFLVSMDGKMLTCAHVVRDTIGKEPHLAGDTRFTVRFPKIAHNEEATVYRAFDSHKDDVVVLQLVSKSLPSAISSEQLPDLVSADHAIGASHKFKSLGYRQSAGERLSPAEGIILDEFIPIYQTLTLHANKLMLQSEHIDSGMSGSAVYDLDLNAVVGIISRKLHKLGTDKNTADAVNMRVVALDPLLMPLYTGELPIPLTPAPNPNPAPAKSPIVTTIGNHWHTAPTVLDTWVGRVDLLAQLTAHYHANTYRILGLIGFGGEGKTSLARKWIKTILDDATPKPVGVFWWSFYEDRSTDAFLEALITYLGGADIAQEERSASSRVGRIAEIVLKSADRYVFILDGFEVMQDAEKNGVITSEALRDLLKHLALPIHPSQCVITSRAPLPDLDGYIRTYQHIDITRLSEPDGVALMKELGVTGDDTAIAKTVNAWDGHALTIGLIGAYLMQKHAGDIAKVGDVPPPTADEPLYERVKRLLRQYDENLSDAGRAFMLIFCAFRLPVKVSAFGAIFRVKTSATRLNDPLTTLTDEGFTAQITQLVTRKLITAVPRDNDPAYTTHPLIRAHYDELLMNTAEDAKPTHKAIAGLYEADAEKQPSKLLPTLDDLKPYIEMVYHLCRAGTYDEALDIYWKRILRGNEFLIIYKLGAYETELTILLEFFPKGDTTQDPALTKPGDQRFILNSIGVCYQNLGRLSEAVLFTERTTKQDSDTNDYLSATTNYLNLTSIAIELGDLEKARTYADNALVWVQKMDVGQDRQRTERNLLTYRAWVMFLHGETDGALALFTHAEALQKEFEPTAKYLYSLGGIWHSDCLRRKGNLVTSRAIANANLKWMIEYNFIVRITRCHRVLGDLDADMGQFDSAQTHYDEAVRIVRTIDVVYVRIEALSARGRFFAVHRKDAKSAFNDLNEALTTAINGEYKLYEADIRIGLAWAYLADGKKDDAKREADIARTMSVGMGYHWGVVDAEEILKHLQRKIS